MKRHVYRPPNSQKLHWFAIFGGLLATIGVFIAIPLTQKLTAVIDGSSVPPPEIVVEPPDDQSFETEEPPEEVEPEPEPEEMVEEATELDLGIDLSALTAGTGGGFIMEIPKFALKGSDDAMGSELDSPATPTTKIQPTFPNSLLKKGVGGRVLISCSVDAKGQITAATIHQSSGQPLLDDAALKAVRKWKFKPASNSGKAIASKCIVPFNFEVKKN
ncbi:MAG: energy transducer TonB [Verrucomicrobia bacterium]|nr:MAG: energy transducer TonB [Verrucomicrobiota bacterium]